MATTAALQEIATPARLGVSLLEAEPELGSWLDPEDRLAARAATRVPAVDLQPGPFDPRLLFAAGTKGFGAMIVSGRVAREVSLGGQPALRLFGPGDMFLDEPLAGDMVQPVGAWSASLATRVAILDDHLLLAIRRWPRLVHGILGRLQHCHDDSLLQLAISHQPRVEDRLVALFQLLATRWGRMTPEGVAVPIALTHEALGRMVGARRPTVTLALRGLGAQGRLKRDERGRWLLGGEITPPGDFQPLVNGQLPKDIFD